MMASRGSAVRFGVLGTLEVWDGDDRLQVGGPRARAVLAALLLEANRVVSLSRLVDAVWEDAPPATAEHQVRKAVAELRARIPDGRLLLLTDGPGYRMVVDGGQLDLLRFEKALARARAATDTDEEAAALEGALALYRGRALPEGRSPLLAAAATMLEDRQLGARERLLELRLEQGRTEEAVAGLRSLVAEHPLRESAAALLMVALCRTGRQADALRVYHQLRHLLAEQLGIDPGPEAALRYEQILRNEPALHGGTPRPGRRAAAGPAGRPAPPPALPEEPHRAPGAGEFPGADDEHGAAPDAGTGRAPGAGSGRTPYGSAGHAPDAGSGAAPYDASSRPGAATGPDGRVSASAPVSVPTSVPTSVPDPDLYRTPAPHPAAYLAPAPQAGSYPASDLASAGHAASVPQAGSYPASGPRSDVHPAPAPQPGSYPGSVSHPVAHPGPVTSPGTYPASAPPPIVYSSPAPSSGTYPASPPSAGLRPATDPHPAAHPVPIPYSGPAPAPYPGPAPVPPPGAYPLPVLPPAPYPASVPPRSLPHDLPDFTGREEETRRLLSHAGREAERPVAVMAVDGMAGVGKTALAVHAAHRLAPHYPDGQIFLDLHGFTAGRTPLTAHTALGVLLRAVGVPDRQLPPGRTDREQLWRAVTAGRRLLLLIDNAAASEQVRPLVPGTPGSLVLVTSRPRLSALDGAVHLSLQLPPPGDALRLLGAVLGRERPRAEPEAAADLVTLCGRLPLALRVAAGRLRNRPQWTIAALNDRLRDESARLAGLVAEHRAVATALDLSRTALPTPHRRFFHLLGLHPGPDFDARTAAVLTGTSPAAAEALLEDLLDAHLLTQHTPGRYAFHELVRLLARHHPDAPPPATVHRAVHRLLDHYLRTATRAAELIDAPARPALPAEAAPADEPLADEPAALAWFQAERPGLLSALALAEERGLDRHAVRLALALAPCLRLRGHTEDERQVLGAAAAAARRLGDHERRLTALTDLAAACWHLGRVAEGLESAQEALALAEELDDGPGTALCLSRISMFSTTLGRYEEAIDFLHRALALLSGTGADGEEGTALACLGTAQSALGRHAEALQTSRLVTLGSRTAGDAHGEITGLTGEAASHAAAGAFDTALRRLAEASALAHRIVTPHGQAVVLARYADVYRRQGRHDEALRAGHAALGLLRTVRRPALAATVHNVLGAVHRARGDLDLARRHHQQARRLARYTGLRSELVLALDGIAKSRAPRAGHRPGRPRTAPFVSSPN
ncbi:AfsR/SARP family transcriptional regulator [Streptomyces mobaraensis]|uniref:AfsR/SARP family transcriptional regulator n=1 Tax=Streptomyces mobaraensis TaxID=35621 RepID=UPI00340B3348